MRKLAVLGLGAVLAVSACGSNGPPEADAAIDGLPEKPSSLTVRTWAEPWSSALDAAPVQAFTEETGIEVVFDTTEYDVMDTTIRTAVDAGQRPPVDVHYTMEKSAYLASVQGISVPLDSDIVTNFENLTIAGKPPEGSDYVTIYTYSVPLIYRTDLIEMPEDPSWDVLWSEDLEDLVFMNGTAEAMLFPISEMVGVEPGVDDMDLVWDKLSELDSNVKSIGFDTQFIEGMTSGDIAAGAMLVGNAVELQEAGVPVDWVVPREGAWLTGDSMYVPVGLPDNVTYWAQVFINYVIDAQLQSEWTNDVMVIPTNADASPGDEMIGDPAFPFTDEEIEQYTIRPPVDIQARNTDGWQSRYMETIQQ